MATAGKVPKTVGAKSPNLKGGSRKGKPNKATAQLKDMILGALDQAGGVEYLTKRANDPKTASAFLTLIGKVLPMQVVGSGENGEHLGKVVVEFVRPGS